MPTAITGLDDFCTALAVLPLGNGQRVLGVLHLPTPDSSELATAKAYLVASDWRATLIGASDAVGKDAGLALERDGTTLYLYVSEASAGGAGSSSMVHVYAFPDALPAAVNPVAVAIYNANGAIATALTRENQRLAPLVGAG